MAAESADLQDRSILVTGGAGFIGSHLAERLLEDNTVTILDDLSTGKEQFVSEEAELVIGDVRDRALVSELVAGVDLVFHLAARVSVEESMDQPIEYFETNAQATWQVLEAARQHDARVVYASSAAVYGEPDTTPIAEDHPTTPTSPYGLSKLIGEQACRMYGSSYELPCVALRYFNVYGPRQGASGYGGVIDAFIEQARRGEPLTVHGDGTQTRDFVHVSDVVEANVRAAIDGTPGAAYNIGTGESISIRDLAETILTVTDGDGPITHTDPRAGDIQASEADISKAEAELGFEPSSELAIRLQALSTRAAAGCS